jgi:hypothetical protein
MEMKAMPTAMDALLDLRDSIVYELNYLEKAQSVNEEKKAFLVTLYNMLPDEVAEGIVKKEGEEEWYEN